MKLRLQSLPRFSPPPTSPDHWPDVRSVRWSVPEYGREAFQSLEVLRRPSNRHWRRNAANHEFSHHQAWRQP